MLEPLEEGDEAGHDRDDDELERVLRKALEQQALDVQEQSSLDTIRSPTRLSCLTGLSHPQIDQERNPRVTSHAGLEEPGHSSSLLIQNRDEEDRKNNNRNNR